MSRAKRVLFCLLVLMLPVLAAAQPPEPPPQQPAPAQEEFVPLEEIPPEEQIPAFTLLASAYALVWVALAAYVWSVATRLQKVDAELAALSRERRQGR